MLAAPISIPAASECAVSRAFQSTFFCTDPLLFACRRLLFIILLLQAGMVDSARFRLVNKKPTNGVRSAERRRAAKPFLVPADVGVRERLALRRRVVPLRGSEKII
jgi:hypothetical protein